MDFIQGGKGGLEGKRKSYPIPSYPIDLSKYISNLQVRSGSGSQERKTRKVKGQEKKREKGRKRKKICAAFLFMKINS